MSLRTHFAKVLSLFFAFITTSAHAFIQGKIALIQYNADQRFGRYDENIKNLTAYSLQAIQLGAKIIVFPEGSAYGYSDSRAGTVWCSRPTSGLCKNVNDIAETIPSGKTTKYWDTIAKKYGVYIVFNLPEKDGAKYYNTSAVVGPNGYMGRYRKRALYITDKYYASPGKDPFILETPYGKFGLAICMDIHYSFIRDYVKQGVNGIIFPTDWDEPPPEAIKDFSEAANHFETDIYASDVSAWDGTGKYFPQNTGGAKRLRPGLPEIGVNVEGLTILDLNYAN